MQQNVPNIFNTYLCHKGQLLATQDTRHKNSQLELSHEPLNQELWAADIVCGLHILTVAQVQLLIPGNRLTIC